MKKQEKFNSLHIIDTFYSLILLISFFLLFFSVFIVYFEGFQLGTYGGGGWGWGVWGFLGDELVDGSRRSETI